MKKIPVIIILAIIFVFAAQSFSLAAEGIKNNSADPIIKDTSITPQKEPGIGVVEPPATYPIKPLLNEGSDPVSKFGETSTDLMTAYENLTEDIQVSMFNGKANLKIGFSPNYGGLSAGLGVQVNYSSAIHDGHHSGDIYGAYLIVRHGYLPTRWNSGLGWYIGACKILLNWDSVNVHTCINPDGSQENFYPKDNTPYFFWPQIGNSLSRLNKVTIGGEDRIVLLEVNNAKWTFKPGVIGGASVGLPEKYESADRKYYIDYTWEFDDEDQAMHLTQMKDSLGRTITFEWDWPFWRWVGSSHVHYYYKVITKISWQNNDNETQIVFGYDGSGVPSGEEGIGFPLLKTITVQSGNSNKYMVYEFQYYPVQGVCMDDMLLKKVINPAGGETEITYKEREFYCKLKTFDGRYLQSAVVNKITKYMPVGSSIEPAVYTYNFPQYDSGGVDEYEHFTSTMTDLDGNIFKYCHYGCVDYQGALLDPNIYGMIRRTEVFDAKLNKTIQRTDYGYAYRQLTDTYLPYWAPEISNRKAKMVINNRTKISQIYGSDSCWKETIKEYDKGPGGNPTVFWSEDFGLPDRVKIIGSGTGAESTTTHYTYENRANPDEWEDEWVIGLPKTEWLTTLNGTEVFAKTEIQYNSTTNQNNYKYLKPDWQKTYCYEDRDGDGKNLILTGALAQVYENYNSLGLLTELSIRTNASDPSSNPDSWRELQKTTFNYYDSGLSKGLLKEVLDNRNVKIANFEYYPDTGWKKKSWGANGDSLSNFTQYTYDALGRTTRIDSPDSPSISVEYNIATDDFQNPGEETNSETSIIKQVAGKIEKTYFDSLFRPKIKKVNSGCVFFAYDKMGHKTFESVTAEINNTNPIGANYSNFDASGTPWTIEFPDYSMNNTHPYGKPKLDIIEKSGFTTISKQTYTDAVGSYTVVNEIEETFLGNPHIEILDRDNNQNKQIKTSSYDVYGNVKYIEEKDENNGSEILRQRFFTYDSLGKLIKVNTPEGGNIENFYDLQGNLLQSVDNGHATSYIYDDLNRLATVQMSSPTKTIEYKYDGEEFTGVPRPNDNYENQLRKTTAVRCVNKNLEDLGGKKFEELRYFIQFDEAGRLELEDYRYKFDGDAGWSEPYLIKYNYDTGLGQIESIQYPGQIDGNPLIVKYGYGDFDRMKSVDLECGDETKSIVKEYKYNFAGCLDEINLKDNPGSRKINMGAQGDFSNLWDYLKFQDNGNTRINLDYAYDARGNVLSIKNNICGEQEQGYLYDTLNRLIIASVDNVTHTYGYDKFNNLIHETIGEDTIDYTINAKNQIDHFVKNSQPSGNFGYHSQRGYLNFMVDPKDPDERRLFMEYEDGTNLLKKTEIKDHCGGELGARYNYYGYNPNGEVLFSVLDKETGEVETNHYLYDSSGRYLMKEIMNARRDLSEPILAQTNEYFIYGANGLEAKLSVEADNPYNYPTAIALNLNKEVFMPDDVMYLDLVINNLEASNRDVNIYVALQVNDSYWFWPTWCLYPSLDFVNSTLPAAPPVNTLRVLDFIWPAYFEGSSAGMTLNFWAILVDPESNEMVSNLANVDFQFTDGFYPPGGVIPNPLDPQAPAAPLEPPTGPVTKPLSMNIWLNKYMFYQGDTMTLSAQIENPNPISVDFYLAFKVGDVIQFVTGIDPETLAPTGFSSESVPFTVTLTSCNGPLLIMPVGEVPQEIDGEWWLVITPAGSAEHLAEDNAEFVLMPGQNPQ